MSSREDMEKLVSDLRGALDLPNGLAVLKVCLAHHGPRLVDHGLALDRLHAENERLAAIAELVEITQERDELRAAARMALGFLADLGPQGVTNEAAMIAELTRLFEQPFAYASQIAGERLAVLAILHGSTTGLIAGKLERTQTALRNALGTYSLDEPEPDLGPELPGTSPLARIAARLKVLRTESWHELHAHADSKPAYALARVYSKLKLFCEFFDREVTK